MKYKITLNSILLIPFLVMIESCMTPTPIKDNPTTSGEKTNLGGESKNGSSHPDEQPVLEIAPTPKIEVSFLYSKDGGTEFVPLKNASQLYSGDRLKVKIIPKEDAFITIQLVNNSTRERYRLDLQYGLTKLKAGKTYTFPEEGSIVLSKTKANETLCVFGYKTENEYKASSSCNQGNVVKKVNYKLN